MHPPLSGKASSNPDRGRANHLPDIGPCSPSEYVLHTTRCDDFIARQFERTLLLQTHMVLTPITSHSKSATPSTKIDVFLVLFCRHWPFHGSRSPTPFVDHLVSIWQFTLRFAGWLRWWRKGPSGFQNFQSDGRPCTTIFTYLQGHRQ